MFIASFNQNTYQWLVFCFEQLSERCFVSADIVVQFQVTFCMLSVIAIMLAQNSMQIAEGDFHTNVQISVEVCIIKLS
jgi:hypothetical protein